ncbi:flagellar hook-length control protein FliK [Marinobacterium sp. D7]|uniref:flagellar hook-length control protein FliK n=1 Tax=Marinobacterium ramblicola TaxID=2849041 RepID=UPI001C2CE777|nr:flagellar hook-length control protein FliK [Marinobacterium ramblicola]MBV1789364.1 flagellar hook-length control protein FliK [Marinobacterium ramblicola]
MQTLSRPGDGQGVDLRAQLDAGRTLSASVKEVVVDTQRPNLFRIKVEVQNMLMELMTSRPLVIGAQVTLNRAGDGQLLLSLAGQAGTTGRAEAPPQAPAQQTPASGSNSGIRLQIPIAQLQSEALQRALPLNQPQLGRVLPSVTTPAEPASGSAPANTAATTGTQTPAPAASGAASGVAPSATGSAATPTSSAAQQSSQPGVAGQINTLRNGEQPQPATTSQPDNPRPSSTAATASTASNAGTPSPAGTTTAGSTTATTTPSPASAQPQTQTQPQPPNPAPPQSTLQAAGASSDQPRGAESAPPRQPPAAPATRPLPAAATDTASGAALNRSGPNPVQISINGQTIELLTPRPLQAGMTIQLTRTDQANVQLEILPPRIAPDAQQRLQEGLQQILRDSLPQQIPMAEAFNQLRQLDRASGGTGRQQDAIGQVVRSMLSLFSVSTKPDAQTTRQAVEQQLHSSGLIAGKKGAQQSNEGGPATLKDQLARLQQLGERLPPEARERLQSLLQGIQARTATHQASSLQHWQDLPDGSVERQYRLDLPVRVHEQQLDNTEIRITQHKRRDEQDRFISEWSINLHFDLQDLGAIDSRISLQQEWQLSARFWAEHGATAQLIRDRLEVFANHLSSCGFEIDTLHVQQGRQPRETNPPVSRRLVDLHT